MARKKSITCERGGLTRVLFPLKRCLWSHLIFQVYMYFISTCHTGWKTLFDKTRSFTSGGVGRGYSTKLYTGRLHPEVPTCYPFIYHFWQKRYPFHVPSIDKWYPFHIPSLQLCIPFHYRKFTVFKNNMINKSLTNWTFSPWVHKMHLLALLGLFYKPKWHIFYPFIYRKIPKISPSMYKPLQI